MFSARRPSLLAFLYTLSVSSLALAQPIPPGPPIPGPAGGIPGQTTPAPPETKPAPTVKVNPVDSPIPGGFGTPPGVGSSPGAPIDSERFRQALAKALQANTGGLTADSIAKRAKANNPDVAAKREAVRAAAAKVDQALTSFFPRLNGVARYTRLSDSALNPSTPIPFVFGTTGQAGPVNNLNQIAVVPFSFAFPQILDQYTLQATLTVPISDYVFRISQNYSAASHNVEAARYDKVAAEVKAGADAKVAFYQWVKALGQRLAVEQALIGAKEHLKDAQAQESAGQLSKADLLGIESQVAAGELTLAQADQYVLAAEEQLRTMIHAEPNEKFSIGEDFTADLPKAAVDVAALKQEAMSSRLDLKSVEASEVALEKTATVSNANMWPRLDAVGNATYANPNTRFAPQSAIWRATWDVSLQLSWSPNDAFTAHSQSAEVSANAAKVHAQAQQMRDGVQMEVTSAALEVRTADIALESAMTQLTAAEEALRVRREQSKVGKSTTSLLTDAETSLLKARLTAINARLDQRIARVKLEHAVGRDASRELNGK
ncbi:MAG: TolC family protein [Polyangiaceae bacterium]